MTKQFHHSLACGNLGFDKVKKCVVHVKEKGSYLAIVCRIPLSVHSVYSLVIIKSVMVGAFTCITITGNIKRGMLCSMLFWN